MMIRDHSTIEELLGARALDGLDPKDQAALIAEMDAHGPDCAECLRLHDEYEEVGGRLAFALDPAPVREGLEEETLALALGSPAPLQEEPPSDTWAFRRRGRTERLREDVGEEVREGLRVRLRPLVAVAAAAVLFVGGWLAHTATTGGGTPGLDVSRVSIVSFEGEGGNLAMAFQPGAAGIFLFGSEFAPLAVSQTYEVWMIEDGTPVPATCFRPLPDGSVFTFVEAELGTTQTMAVTVEAETCPNEPTTEPILTADLTTV